MHKILDLNPKVSKTDVLIIGSGAAGLSLALKLQPQLDVIVVAKSSPKMNSTWFAQGGIASVIQNKDSFESHIKDTLVSGIYLNQPKVVRAIIQSAPDVLNWLVEIGMPFSRYKNQFHLHQEGGHQFRRIFHFEDTTGKALQKALIHNVKKAKNITTINHQFLLNLIIDEKKVIGGQFLNQQKGNIEAIYAQKIVIASGGACNIYQYSSSPITATGDGLVAAYQKGAKIANLEFTQFHPTCFFNESARNLLLTEALRGEGGVLRLKNGKRFMPDYHLLADLAPRDIVARAIDTELKKSGEDCVYLDITHKKSKKVKAHFPNIYKTLKKYGYDLTKHLIPVVPAAHYFCGGIITDLAAKTNLENLYAIGEVAHTGFHGANRLASNSLLECLVMGHFAAKDISQTIKPNQTIKTVKLVIEPQELRVDSERVVIKHLWDQVRQLMSNYVGIMRTTKRLKLAFQSLKKIDIECQSLRQAFYYDQDYQELVNLICISKLTIRCALMRKESRGLHFNADYPNLMTTAKDSVISIEK